MGLTVVNYPDADDVLGILSVADMKLQMRISHDAEDAYFRRCILAAYDWLANPENGWLNRAILTTTYRMTLPGFVKQQVYTDRETGGPAYRWIPTNSIVLPMPTLQTVGSVKYLVDGTPTTLDTPGYVVTQDGLFGKIHLASGASWPTGFDVNPNAVTIEYTAGYGDADTIKERCPGLVQAMSLLAGDAYRNREDTYAEPRLVAVNRKIMNGVQFYAGRYRIINRHA